MGKHPSPVAVSDCIDSGDSCHAVFIHRDCPVCCRYMNGLQAVSFEIGSSSDAEKRLFAGNLFSFSVRFHCDFPVSKGDCSCIQAEVHSHFLAGFLNHSCCICIEITGNLSHCLYNLNLCSGHSEIGSHFKADDTAADHTKACRDFRYLQKLRAGEYKPALQAVCKPFDTGHNRV